MALKRTGYFLQLLGFIGALLTVSIANGASVSIVIAGIMISCMLIVLGKFLVGYAIYLKQEREDKMITRCRKEKSA